MKPLNRTALTRSILEGSYRVDVLETKDGNEYQVVRCEPVTRFDEPVARFDNPDLATFLVELLQDGRSQA